MTKYLQNEYPEIAKEFDIIKNNITPENIAVSSNKKYWWKCKNGHVWQQSVRDRVSLKNGCRQCRSLGFLYSDIAKEWDYEKNEGLDVNKIAAKTSKVVWWKCSKCGQSYQMRIDSRTVKGVGCQACKGKQLYIGMNDLKSSNLGIVDEWNYEKNAPLLPEDVTVKSTKKVWWKCSKCGYEWEASVIDRIKNKECPCCIGKVVIKNKNDILTTHPEIIDYWDFKKNEKDPEEYPSNSNKIVYWKCTEGHSWKEKISKAIAKHFECPICSNVIGTSFPEQALFYYIKKYFPDAINRKRFSNYEIDIYIPSLNLGIEYDGHFYHKNENREEKKDSFIFENYKIYIIHIVEMKKIEKTNYYTYIPSNQYYDNINEAINIVFDYITNLTGVVFNKSIDIKVDRPYIYNHYLKKVEYENSIAYQYPKLEKEWDYEKNYPLSLKNISAKNISTPIYAWWKCEHCGYEVFDSVSSRAKRKGCILCQGADKALSDMLFADIFYGKMIEYKGYNKHALINETYMFYNNKEWICDCGNMFVTSAYKLMNGYRCPKCNKQIKNIDELKLNYNQIINKQLDRIDKRKQYLKLSKNTEKKEILINSNIIDKNKRLNLIFMEDNLMKYGIEKIINNSFFDKDNHKMEIDITAIKYKDISRSEIRPLLVAKDKNNEYLFYARVGDYYDEKLESIVEQDEREMAEIRFNDFPQLPIMNGVVSLEHNWFKVIKSMEDLEKIYHKVNNVYIIFMTRNSKLYFHIDKMIKLINKSLIK